MSFCQKDIILFNTLNIIKVYEKDSDVGCWVFNVSFKDSLNAE